MAWRTGSEVHQAPAALAGSGLGLVLRGGIEWLDLVGRQGGPGLDLDATGLAADAQFFDAAAGVLVRDPLDLLLDHGLVILGGMGGLLGTGGAGQRGQEQGE